MVAYHPSFSEPGGTGRAARKQIAKNRRTMLGFNPEVLSRRAMFLFLLRLIPYCEHNYHYNECYS